MTIENGDMPASPSGLDIAEYAGTINCSYNKPLTGLTKREACSISALQGLLSNSVMADSSIWESPQEWVKQMTESSVEMADALLKELEK